MDDGVLLTDLHSTNVLVLIHVQNVSTSATDQPLSFRIEVVFLSPFMLFTGRHLKSVRDPVLPNPSRFICHYSSHIDTTYPETLEKFIMNNNSLMNQNPRLRWEDGVEEDVARLGCRNSKGAALNCEWWRKLLKEAEAHPGLYRRWRDSE